MKYYDIHTHQISQEQNENAVFSLDLRAPFKLHPDRLYAAGIHPWYADDKQWEVLKKWISHPRIVLVGEAGLDRLALTPPNIQEELFIRQIGLSEEAGKPLIIHCVKAWDELLRIRRITHPVMPWIIHGFRGKKQLAEQLLGRGFYLSFGAHYHPEALQAAWTAGRLLLETDDSPIHIGCLYREVAEELQITETLLSQTVGSIFIPLITSPVP